MSIEDSWRLMGYPEAEIDRMRRRRQSIILPFAGVEFVPMVLAVQTFPVHDEPIETGRAELT